MAKGRERSAKWYFQNEKEVMQDLGLEPTKGSGGGWIEKEDGQNDFVIAQLKSTDKESYKLKQFDLERLEYNATVANKVPVFIVQFLNKDTRYAIVAIDDLPKVSEYIKTGEINNVGEIPVLDIEDTKAKPIAKKIASSKKARNDFYKKKDAEWERKKWKQ